MTEIKSFYALLVCFVLCLFLGGCNFPGIAARPSPTISTPQSVETGTPKPGSPTISPPVSPSPGQTLPPPSPTGPPVSSPAPGATQVDGSIHIVNIAMIDQSHGWALASVQGSNDQVLRTTDGGQTWFFRTPPEPLPEKGDITKKATGVFQDMDTAWLIYQNEPAFAIPDPLIVWQTLDGGATWQASNPLDLTGQPEFLTLSDFQTTMSGIGFFLAHIGVGMNHDYLMIFRSDPTGMAWNRVADPFETPDIQGCQKTGLDFLDGNLGWMTVDCQGVRDIPYYLDSMDGGQTWATVELPPPGEAPDLFSRSFCGVYSPDRISSESGLLALRCISRVDFSSHEDFLYKTLTGGETWETYSFPGGEFLFLDQDQFFALARDIYRTINQGESWDFVKTVNWDGQFSFVDTLHGWAVARAGDAIALVKTIDGGLTWQEITPAFE